MSKLTARHLVGFTLALKIFDLVTEAVFPGMSLEEILEWGVYDDWGEFYEAWF